MTASVDLPPFENQRLLSAPFPERVRMVCQSWAALVAPTPFYVIVAYWVKYFLFFIGGWAFFVSFSADYAGVGAPLEWAFHGDAFHRFLLWAIFYETIGLGCSSGPMNARFIPPIGGVLYFLRPGTTKLPLFPGAPVIGHLTRNWIDVAINAAILASLLRALVAPEVTVNLLWPCALLLPIAGLLDKTTFLAARGEHYWVALVCLVVASADGVWISACKTVWCAVWFWAAVSKINHHFPTVIMVMMNNGPFFPKWLKKNLFARYPDDLRPSRLANWMAVFGAATEILIPFALLATSESALLTGVVLFVMCGFHGYIAANNPSGMPIEWNILMIYGGIFLFGFHPEVSILAMSTLPLLALFLFVSLVAIPLFGNLFPARMSFLMAMRYYAGNWAYNIWFVRKDALHKLDRLKKPAGTMRQQLDKMLDDEESVDVAVTLGMAHRFMHLEGRPLLEAIPKAVDDIDQYDWIEGEVLGGSVIGWNFGDGHLNDTQLLESVQAQCGFEPGEVRVVMVESQPLFGPKMAWKVVDGATGMVESGETEIAPARAWQPWDFEAAARAGHL